jgi:hypothetical protein
MRTPLPSGPNRFTAKRGGKQATNGKSIPVTCYPRKRTKALLVEIAQQVEQGVSAFLIISGLEKVARIKAQGNKVEVLTESELESAVRSLIPEEEYAELLRKRGGKGKK